MLLSGGLDSTTALFWAKSRGYELAALSVDYGQRHVRELEAARAVARLGGSALHELSLKLPWLQVSSLLDRRRKLPNVPLSRIGRKGIPSTYVPGRNTILLSLGVSLADATGAEAVVLGSNALDYSGYPDCRPEFIEAFEKMANLATRAGVEGRQALKIHTPLIAMTKAQIVAKGIDLGVDYSLTSSCYDPSPAGEPCGQCDSCLLRQKGFRENGLVDPLHYQAGQQATGERAQR